MTRSLGVIESAPRFVKLKTRQTEIEFFDFDDFERLVDGARKVDPAVLAFVLLAGEAGLRRGEIIALDLTDADFRRGQLTIARSDWCGHIGTTKGGKTRRVPMTTRLAAALQAIRHLRGPRMLYQRNAEPVSENALRSWMERAERAGSLAVTGHIHQLRHTFCSHLAMRGARRKRFKSWPAMRTSRRQCATCACRQHRSTRRSGCSSSEVRSGATAGCGKLDD